MGNFRPARLPAAVRALAEAAGGLPSAHLDFENGEYFYPFFKPAGFLNFPGASFTRASSAWDFVGGVLTEFAADVPRIIPGVGLRSEGAGTELFTHSANFADASWFVETGTTRAGLQSSPVSSRAAQRFDYASGNGRVQKNVTFSAVRHTAHVIMRPVAPFRYITIRAPLSSGLALTNLVIDAHSLSVVQSSSPYSNITATLLADGYVLVRFEFLPVVGGTDRAFYVYGSDAVSDNSATFASATQPGSYDLALFSIQPGVHASPIVTDASVITRGVDNARLLDLSALGLANMASTGCTILADVTLNNGQTHEFPWVFGLSNGSWNDRHGVYWYRSNERWVSAARIGGTSTLATDTVASPIGARHKVAASFNPGGGHRISVAGRVESNNNAVDLSVQDRLEIMFGDNRMIGTLHSLSITPNATSAAEISALTAGDA